MYALNKKNFKTWSNQNHLWLFLRNMNLKDNEDLKNLNGRWV